MEMHLKTQEFPGPFSDMDNYRIQVRTRIGTRNFRVSDPTFSLPMWHNNMPGLDCESSWFLFMPTPSVTLFGNLPHKVLKAVCMCFLKLKTIKCDLLMELYNSKDVSVV